MSLCRPKWLDRGTINVIQMAVALHLLFFAYITQSFVEEAVLESRSRRTGGMSKMAGYYSQAIMYACLVVSNFLAPPVIDRIGCRLSLFLGSLVYTVFLVGFLFMSPIYLYVSSALEGLGAGLLWTAMGEYLTRNSSDRTASRNSSLAWMIYMGGLTFGGVFLWVAFDATSSNSDEPQISQSTARVIYGSLTGVSVIGNVIMALLGAPVFEKTTTKVDEKRNVRSSILDTLRILRQPDVILLIFTFCFSGLEWAFWSAIYPTALQFTHRMSTLNTHRLVAAAAVATGLGELFGGLIFSLLKSARRRTIIALGSLLAVVNYALVFVNLPSTSTMENVNSNGILAPPRGWLAIINAFVMGLVDSCVNTQLYALLAVAYRDKSAHAYATYNLFHALSSTAATSYGGYVIVQVQLGVLCTFAIASAVSFAYFEYSHLPRLMTVDFTSQ